MTDDVLVSLDDVSVEFTSGDGTFDFFSEPSRVRAVDGVSLDVRENETIALVGESGCGKSTLGRTAIGVQRPTGGSVSFRGQDVWATKDDGVGQRSFEEIRRSLQMIHQDPGSSLNPNQRIMTSLELPVKRWYPDLSRQERQRRIHSLLEHVGLKPASDFANRFPHQLSGGEQQRVALIRTLLINPDLILADEAISALDVSLRVEMMDLMLELQDMFETSYIFISHNLANAKYLTEKSGGRIAVMYLGKIVEVGPVDEVVENPSHPYTQALKWATPELYGNESEGDFPLRRIDVPDPDDVPSGCRFHPRCGEAREVCQGIERGLYAVNGDIHASR
jgi:peptide/nickel transport system ATP-binding protein